MNIAPCHNITKLLRKNTTKGINNKLISRIDELKMIYFNALLFIKINPYHWSIKVARYRFSGSIPPTFERKLRRHKQRFGKINTTVVLDKGENLL